MVKPLSFKGDKKPAKKRKRADADAAGEADSFSTARTTLDAADHAIDDDSWVSAEAPNDISGPTFFVLPTAPPSCLATDANGNVSVAAVENLAEGDDNGLTAEPQDVREVWVANRVAGTENFSFKGHHGKYLSCDKFGVLSATREAIGHEESFLVIPVPADLGVFSVQTQREKFIAVDEVEGKGASSTKLRGDADFVEYRTGIRIRMQARFKPRLKASKEEKAKEKISRKDLEEMVGRRLGDEDVKKLKRARKEGNFHEVMLDVKVKGKHDKFA